ncbi:MAG: hypothetical protein MUF54_08260 [Polyangiaceae bacterium]|jgi:hypothetical protein|nr:hypothetical protein [Polyangiaceae bacterium]
MERCHDCDCEIATAEDWAHPSGCQCKRCVTLWGWLRSDQLARERALKAEARIAELESELEPTGYVAKTDALRRERDEARAEVKRLTAERDEAVKLNKIRDPQFYAIHEQNILIAGQRDKAEWELAELRAEVKRLRGRMKEINDAVEDREGFVLGGPARLCGTLIRITRAALAEKE